MFYVPVKNTLYRDVQDMGEVAKCFFLSSEESWITFSFKYRMLSEKSATAYFEPLVKPRLVLNSKPPTYKASEQSGN